MNHNHFIPVNIVDLFWVEFSVYRDSEQSDCLWQSSIGLHMMIHSESQQIYIHGQKIIVFSAEYICMYV